MVSGSGNRVHRVMVMKTFCTSASLPVPVFFWVGLVRRLERHGPVSWKSVFHSDFAYASAFWSFGHSPILTIIIVIFVSCSGPGDSNKSVSLCLCLCLCFLCSRFPYMTSPSSVGVSDSGSSINIITKTRMIHTNFFALCNSSNWSEWIDWGRPDG